MKSDVYGCERERKIQLDISNKMQPSLCIWMKKKKKKLKLKKIKVGPSALVQYRPRFFANRN